MEQAYPRRLKWAWMGGSALALLLIVVALKLDYFSPQAPVKKNQVTVRFEDGAALEILGVSVGERVVEVHPEKTLKFLSSNGSSGGSWGGLNVESESEDGHVIRSRLRSEAKNALLMEFRIVNSDGTPGILPSYLTNHEAVFQDSRMGGKGAPTGFFKPQNDSVETLRQEMTRVGLLLLIQHHDPRSGWMNLMGPSMFEESWPDRYIVALGAWQRNLPTLDFRAVRADGQVAEFSLPNPDFRKSPTPATAVTIPHVHHADDFTLTVNGVRRYLTEGNHPFAAVDLDLQFKDTPSQGFGDGPISFDGATNGAEDEWGNVVDFERNTIHKRPVFGAFLPANSKHMTLNLVIQRNQNYPHSSAAGFIVFEGTVTADGMGVDFKPGPDADLFGIKKMPSCVIKPAPRGIFSGVTKDWQQLEFEIEGENASDELDAIQSRIGEINTWQFPVFIGDDNDSSGISFGNRGGGSGSGADRFNFHRGVGWCYTPDMLKPGTRVRVGISAPPGNETLKFDLALPELVEPR